MALAQSDTDCPLEWVKVANGRFNSTALPSVLGRAPPAGFHLAIWPGNEPRGSDGATWPRDAHSGGGAVASAAVRL